MSELPLLAYGTVSAGAGTLPVDLELLVASRMLVQANSGGGKSWALRYLLEQTHGRIQQIVLDPEGEFASLREHFDYLLAGPDGDVPATPPAAKLLCRRLLELDASAVVDLYDLKVDDRRAFVRIFLDELMHLPRALWRPLLVVIDEAHVFCPERGAGEAESREAVTTLCTQGRKRGFCAVLATQRISKLHKDAAAELLNKLVGRTGLDVDLNRAGDELGFDKKQRQALKYLSPGQFYVYGPAVSREVTLARMGKIQTSHPQPGAIAPPAPPTPAGLRDLIAQLQDLPQQAAAEARTVDELREQLHLLQTAVNTGRANKAVQDPRPVQEPQIVERIVEVPVEVPVLSDEHAQRLTDSVQALTAMAKDQAQMADQLMSLAAELKTELARIEGGVPVAPVAPPAALQAPAPAVPASRPPAPPIVRRKPASGAKPATNISGPQQRILDALASFAGLGIETVQRSNVAVWSGASPTSSAFTNNLGTLRTAGLIDYPSSGRVALTDAGASTASWDAGITSRGDLHRAWLRHLSGPQGRIITELVECYPRSLGREALADLSGASATSSAYTNNLGSLRSLGLIDYPERGMVVATALLFPPGLP